MKRKRNSIYFIKAGEFCKIGYSQNPKKRLTNIRVSCPYDAILHFEFELPQFYANRRAKNIERMLHELFKDKYFRGEWFRLDEQDIDKAKKWFEKELQDEMKNSISIIRHCAYRRRKKAKEKTKLEFEKAFEVEE